MWSIVFPVGMYGVASRELGSASHVAWLVTLRRDEAWLALAVWAVVSLAMARALLTVDARRQFISLRDIIARAASPVLS